MAFTGAATVVKISDGLSRITGLSLGSGATGTIGLAGSGADVELENLWAPYAGDANGDGAVDLAEAVQCWWTFVTGIGGGSALDTSYRIHQTKVNGDDPATFLISLISTDGIEGQSAEMEIYVRFH